MHIWTLFAVTLGLVLGSMVWLWLISLAKKDASIVDSFWGMGFVLIAWTSYGLATGYRPRKLLLCVLVTIWGLRLAVYIFTRNRGKGEDYRYQAMRKYWGNKFSLVSLFTVFLLQGLLMWVISLPLQVAIQAVEPDRLTLLDYLGAVIWAIGFAFEAIGDWQLKKFKAIPENRGKVMDQGLWRYTRHPNYFGDALLWWGYYVMALAVPSGYLTVLSPLLMTVLLLRVSGVALLEKGLVKTKPRYLDYINRTSAFFPLPPKASRGR